MRVLLGTHALLWLITDPTRLSTTARSVLGDTATTAFVSAATTWEIADPRDPVLAALPGVRALR